MPTKTEKTKSFWNKLIAPMQLGAAALAVAITFSATEAKATCQAAPYGSAIDLINDWIMDFPHCSKSEQNILHDAFLREAWGQCVYNLGSSTDRSLLGVTASNRYDVAAHHPFVNKGFNWGRRTRAMNRVAANLPFTWYRGKDFTLYVMSDEDILEVRNKCNLQ